MRAILPALVCFVSGVFLGIAIERYRTLRRRLMRVQGYERMMDAFASMAEAAKRAEKKLAEQRKNAEWN